MKLDRLIVALLWLVFVYALIFLASFGSFLRVPVFPGQNLMWQAIIEQFVIWLPLLGAFYCLYRSLSDQPRLEKPLFSEGRLVIPGLFLTFLAGFSVGVHSVAQIFGELLIQTEQPFLVWLAVVFDEYIGHLFLLSITLLSAFFMVLEINRKPRRLATYEKIILYFTAVMSGFFWGVAGIEGGSLYLLIIPLALATILYLQRVLERNKLDLDRLPYTQYYVVATMVMIWVTVIWVARHGFFVSSQDLWPALFYF